MLQSAMQIYEKFFNDTTERIYFIVFLEKPYSLTEKHGKSSLVTRCQARCYSERWSQPGRKYKGENFPSCRKPTIYPTAERR